MKKILSREFCVWIVPPNQGRVKKIRFTTLQFLISIIACVALGASAVLLTGDYARVQLLRMKNLVSLKNVTSERDELEAKNAELTTQVGQLKTANTRVLTYERNIKGRLQELSAIVESATSLGLLEQKDSFAQKGEAAAEGKSEQAHGGVGGAEIDCTGKGAARCKELAEDINPSETDSRASFSINKYQDEFTPRGDLVHELDRYISVLRRLPLGYPGSGEITSRFGYRVSPFSRKVKMHEGTDFSLREGSYIYSTASGTVKTVKRTPTYGLMVDISHGHKLTTRYAHMSRALVKEGQRVKRGDVIGLAGSTGRSTGPHLHYEVRVNGAPRNPSKYMELAYELDKAI